MLPKGWVETEASEVGTWGSGGTPKSTEATYYNGNIPWIRSGDLPDQEITKHEIQITEAGLNACAAKWVPTNSVLVALYGATIGKIGITTYPVTTNQAVAFCIPCEAINPRYLARYFLSIREKLISLGQGGAQPNISQIILKQQIVPLPPIAEQRRIVAKLDSLTARIARARAELERARKNAEHIRIASLGKAFHWNETDLLPGWTRKKIGEIGDVQLGRQRSPKDHIGPHMRPYVRSANITWDGWDLSDVKEMNFSPAEFETFKLQPGDVLLNEGSGSPSEVGKPAIWNDEIKNACFQNTVLRVRSDAFSPELLRYVLLFLARTGAFIKNTQGVNIIHIGKAGLSRTYIPVPPITEQPKILKKIQAGFDAANRLQHEADRCLALVNRLEASLLAKAFRGELVPQDPNDKPASVLLDRIRAERAAAPKPKRGRKQSTQDMPLPRKRQTEKHD